MTPGRGRLGLAAGYAAAAILRLALLFSYPGGYDTESYGIVAEIEARHGNVYAETRRYNYSPVWGRLLLTFDRVGRATGLGLLRTVGLFLLLVDAATALVVASLASKVTRGGSGAAAGLLFFANPVSVLISSWHLQFDALAILFLLFAVRSEKPDRGGRGAVAAWLAASLLAKHVTWFHPLLFWRRLRGWTLAPYAVFLASFLPYAASWREIRDHVFRYRSLSGNYGIEGLLLVRGVPEWAPAAIFGVAVVAAVWFLAPGRDPDRQEEQALARASLRLFLVLLVFLPGFSRQYCVWPIALGSLFPGVGLCVYTIVAAGFLARGFFPFDGAPSWLPGWYGPWWAAVLWLLLELRSSRRQVTGDRKRETPVT